MPRGGTEGSIAVQDMKKTKAQLIEEIGQLRSRLAAIEQQEPRGDARAWGSPEAGVSLRESEERFRSAFEQGLVGMALVGLDLRIIDANRTFCEMVGFTREEICQITFDRLSHPDDMAAERALAQQVLRQEIPSYRLEKRLVGKDGRVVLVDLHACPIRDAQGNVQYGLAAASDITNRRRDEAQLRLLSSAAEQSTEGIAVADLDGNLLFVNRAFAHMHGYEREELHDKHLSIFHTPEQMPSVDAAVRQTRETGEFHGEIWHARRNGSVFASLMHNTLLRDEAGHPASMMAVMRDITERLQAQEALRRSELQYRSTIHAMGDMIHVVDRDLRILLCNRFCHEWLKTLGFAGLVVGRRVPEVFPFLADGVVEEYRQVFETGKLLVTEETTHIGGRDYTTETRKIPVAEGSKVVRVVTVVRDITERTRLEAELRHSQKMEAVGQLAAGIAHDFNNMLTPITGYARFLLRDLPTEDPRHKYADVILRTCRRAAALTRQLLAFSRKQVLQPEVLDVNSLVVDMDGMLRRIIGEDVHMSTVLCPTLRHVRADRAQIEQVIMNLVVNAREAMPQGGKLVIKTQNVSVDAQEPFGFAKAGPGDYICLAVADTGEGIAEGDFQRIFEPFYTTKGLANSTGLGLSVVYGIVEQHKGDVRVESKLGRGATFTICLPALPSDRSGVSETEEVYARMPRGSGEGILVVEDHADVRQFCTKALQTNGYTVFEASSVQEAIEVLHAQLDNIQLVFTDVVLPDRDGLQLADEILALEPGLKIVLASGYTGDRVRWPVIQERGFPFVQKPYALSDLLRVIHDALESGNAGTPP